MASITQKTRSTDMRPFSALKVVDVTRVLASPYAAYQLGLFGAEVIKIEDPGVGDPMRHQIGNRAELGKHGMATGYLAQNSNKKSLTLNLRVPQGQEVFRRLANDSDVIIENLRSGTMARYGLGYEDMRVLNPRVIYCSVTGYGQTGPKKRHPAYDPVIQAACGMMSFTGTAETAPMRIGPPIIDYGTGLAAALAIVIALYQRERSGEGQYIDVSMLDTSLSLMHSVVTDVLTTGSVPKPGGLKSRNRDNYTNGTFQCSDALISIDAMENHQRERLWVALGRPDIPIDPRFSTLEACRNNTSALHEEMESTLKTRPAQYWEDVLNEAAVPAMRVRTVPEILSHPQMESRGFFHTIPEVPGAGGPATVPLAPFLMSGATAKVDTPPPLLGQHTDEILQKLGYSAGDISDFHSQGVV